MLEFINTLGSNPFWVIAWRVFINGGWAVFVILLVYLLFTINYLDWRNEIYYSKIKFIVLAIDVPEDEAQSPKAVEHIYTSLMGTFLSYNKKETWIDGMFTMPFSFEIVSIEGYIQFLVYLPEISRDVLEAAVFAQYPNSQIVQVEDYTENVPSIYPDDEWDIWGAEIGLIKPEIYPIKTYPYFEHSLTQTSADPLASMLEYMSRLGPGEQAWFQMVITPGTDAWQKEGIREAKKLAGNPDDSAQNIFEKTFGKIGTELADVINQGLGREPGGENGKELRSNFGVFSLTPGEQQVIKSVQQKATTTGFKTKMRFIYAGKKEVFNKAKGVAGFFGPLRQFSSLDLNGLKPLSKTMTRAHYVFTKKRIAFRKNNIMRHFKNRSQTKGSGGTGFILNTEELATIWHFPGIEVKAPQVKRSDSKAVEPPMGLPIESVLAPITPIDKSHDKSRVMEAGTENLESPDLKPHITLDDKRQEPNVSIEGGPPGNLPVG